MRKNQRKINKLLPLVMITTVLCMMLALGASAIELDQLKAEGFSDCCLENMSCLISHAEGDRLLEDMGDGEPLPTIELTCSTCGNVAVFTMVNDETCQFATIRDGVQYKVILYYDSGRLLLDSQPADENGESIDGGYYCNVASYTVLGKANSSSGGMVGSMVGHVTNGLGGTLRGVGSSIVTFFDNTVLDAEGNLTTFATWSLAFLGIAFGLGALKFIPALVRR